MQIVIVKLFVALIAIVIAAEVFTNALEHLGERLKISEGVTGSLFAAVGTAMPESMIPLLALLAGTENQQVNEEIGVGAILGAPLMLSTIALFLMALSVTRARGIAGPLEPERSGLARDLNFFLWAFGLATVALIVPHEWTAVRGLIGSGLVVTYFIYVLVTLRVSAKLVENGHATESHKDLFIVRLGLPDTMPVIMLQLVIGLVLLVGGAKGFIHSVEEVSVILGVSTLLLALLIIPIATELPEKVNSILWIRRRKDTLAFGNITGAMVFQGSLLPAVGIFLTPWEPRWEVLMGVLITYMGALWVWAAMRRGTLKIWQMFVNGGLYVIYLVSVLMS